MRERKDKIPTLVKWAGGKKQLIEQFKPLFPKEIKRYIEPFVGGGAIAFYVLKNHPEIKEVFLSDLNEELINTYKVTRDKVDELITALEKLRKQHSKETFRKVRAEDPNLICDVDRAARFIYLNKTCFNGIYRVNKNGQFNVPIGRYTNPPILVEKDLKEISGLLKKAELKATPFEEILNLAKKGDFLYLDPPYFPLHKKASFTTYTKDKFLDEEQKKLNKIFIELDKRGCKLMLSNSDTSFIRKIYKGYSQKKVMAKRMINCDATKRGKIKELVVLNY